MASPILGLQELTTGQSQPDVPVNAAIRALEAGLGQLSVASIVNAPVGGEVDGDRYIVGAAPTGAFAGHADDVAYYSSGWKFAAPRAGWLAYIVSLGSHYKFSADSPTGWVVAF